MHIVPGSQCTTAQCAAVAELLVAENARAYPAWTIEQATAEVAMPGPLPITFIAIDDGRALGCASLLDDDEVTDWDGRTWLGNVVVSGDARGRGIGSMLVDAVETHARTIDIAELHLVTTSAVDWYLPKGWRTLADADVHGQRMTVMHKTLL